MIVALFLSAVMKGFFLSAGHMQQIFLSFFKLFLFQGRQLLGIQEAPAEDAKCLPSPRIVTPRGRDNPPNPEQPSSYLLPNCMQFAVRRYDQHVKLNRPLFATILSEATSIPEDADLLHLFAPVRHVELSDIKSEPGIPPLWHELAFYHRIPVSGQYDYESIRVLNFRTDTRGASGWDKPPMTIHDQKFEQPVTGYF